MRKEVLFSLIQPFRIGVRIMFGKIRYACIHMLFPQGVMSAVKSGEK